MVHIRLDDSSSRMVQPDFLLVRNEVRQRNVVHARVAERTFWFDLCRDSVNKFLRAWKDVRFVDCMTDGKHCTAEPILNGDHDLRIQKIGDQPLPCLSSS